MRRWMQLAGMLVVAGSWVLAGALTPAALPDVVLEVATLLP